VSKSAQRREATCQNAGLRINQGAVEIEKNSARRGHGFSIVIAARRVNVRLIRSPLMGWSGRAPARPAIEAGRGTKDKEQAMSKKLDSTIAVVGIDIGKNSFHVVGHDERGAIVLRQEWSRVRWKLGSRIRRHV
jgi:hypothetical protein